MASLSCDQQPNRPIYNLTITLNVKDVISAPLASQKKTWITKKIIFMFPPHTNNTIFYLSTKNIVYFFNGFGSRNIFPIIFFN